jgi:hypothetical protein
MNDDRLHAAKDNAVLQAQIQAQEARTHRATVLDILRYFGLPEHDWEALRLIREKLETPPPEAVATLADLDAVIARWQGLHDTADEFSDEPDMDRSEFAVTLKHLRAYRALLANHSGVDSSDGKTQAPSHADGPSAPKTGES